MFAMVGPLEEARMGEGTTRDAQTLLRADVVVPGPVSPATVYICPMHPQVRRSVPGHCPICGMVLEPEVPAANAMRIIRKARYAVGLFRQVSRPIIAFSGQ